MLVVLLRAALIGALLTMPATVLAHGFAGKRFFPATLATEDPFVADELSLPTIGHRRTPTSDDEPAARETDFSIDVSKRITENLGIGFGATYKTVRPESGDSQRGFDNLAASVKYKFYQDDPHETIISAGIDWDIGGSGSKRVGAELFSTITPAVFFGKGFGDLPADVKWLRPMAITGQLGVGLPTRSSTTTVSDEGDVAIERHPHTHEWGLSIQYSLQYHQSFVRDVGLREPFNRMIPVVEFALSTALDRGASGTTGMVNPGLIWAGQHIQFAFEAVIPVNTRSGSQVGWRAQLHFFLDDLFPQTIGRPLIRH
jgi:hypothetical protein